MSIDETLKENLIADVENILDIRLTPNEDAALARCFEITIGHHFKLQPVTDKEATTEQEKPQTAEKERLLLAEEILDKVLDQLKGGSYFLYTTKTRSMVITAMEEYATQKHIPTDCYPKEFVEWCIEAVDTEERAEVDYCYAVWDSHNVLGFDTIDELYQYYLNNVKDK